MSDKLWLAREWDGGYLLFKGACPRWDGARGVWHRVSSDGTTSLLLVGRIRPFWLPEIQRATCIEVRVVPAEEKHGT